VEITSHEEAFAGSHGWPASESRSIVAAADGSVMGPSMPTLLTPVSISHNFNRLIKLNTATSAPVPGMRRIERDPVREGSDAATKGSHCRRLPDDVNGLRSSLPTRPAE